MPRLATGREKTVDYWSTHSRYSAFAAAFIPWVSGIDQALHG